MTVIIVIIFVVLAMLTTWGKNKVNGQQEQDGSSQNAHRSQSTYQRRETPPNTGKTYQPGYYKQKTYQKQETMREKTGVSRGEAQKKKEAQDVKKRFHEKYHEELEENQKIGAQHVWREAGIEEEDGAILASAKLNSYAAEMDNEEDSRVDLMGPVYDLMAKGPDTSIPFRRDFEGEAAELLSRLNR